MVLVSRAPPPVVIIDCGRPTRRAHTSTYTIISITFGANRKSLLSHFRLEPPRTVQHPAGRGTGNKQNFSTFLDTLASTVLLNGKMGGFAFAMQRKYGVHNIIEKVRQSHPSGFVVKSVDGFSARGVCVFTNITINDASAMHEHGDTGRASVETVGRDGSSRQEDGSCD